MVMRIESAFEQAIKQARIRFLGKRCKRDWDPDRRAKPVKSIVN
jgi:hypothetical protein